MHEKSTFKEIFLREFLISGCIFGIPTAIDLGLFWGILSGLIGGIGFGCIMGLIFSNWPNDLKGSWKYRNTDHEKAQNNNIPKN